MGVWRERVGWWGKSRADDGSDVSAAATVSKLSAVQACTRYEIMRIDMIERWRWGDEEQKASQIKRESPATLMTAGSAP